MTRHHLGFTALATWMCAAPLAADDGVFDQYRDLMGDDNPAVFVIDEGEELWFSPQGPDSATLEACVLGLGPGRGAAPHPPGGRRRGRGRRGGAGARLPERWGGIR